MTRTLPRFRSLLPAAVLVALATSPSPGADMTAGATAPAVNDEDIANFGPASGADKWWPGSATSFGNAGMTIGQSFRTGSGAVLLKAVTFQVRDASLATKTYTLRVGTINGTTFNEIASEPATQTIATSADDYWTWTLDTPVLLSPDTDYGVDVGLHSSTSEWTSGIPYVHTMTDAYPQGSRFRSGSAGDGVGDTTMSQVSGERIFHLDLARPLGATLDFVAGFPTDDSTDALIPPELIATFSQDLVPGTGNITIRNLTDSTDVLVAIGDNGVSLADNLLLIETPGLIDWNKSYAIRIDPGTVEGDGGAIFAGIDDDTTWNFTTAAGDPLLLAIAELKDHINGTITLGAAEIDAHKLTIDSEKNRFNDSAAIMTALFDLITTYDTVEGPLWVARGQFNRDSQTNDLDWTIYHVMQYMMDEIYNTPTIAAHEALLDGFKFGSVSNFPGTVAPPAAPAPTHSVQINGSFPATFGRITQGDDLPARKPTGSYLAPGSIATVTVPPALVGQGFKVRVGAHSWDLSHRKWVRRLDRATILYSLDSPTIKVASPYGGGIYIEVPRLANAGVVSIDITGAVRSPYFSAKSFHTTTLNDWLTTERNHPGPWADFQSDKFMMQVPTHWIDNHPDPVTLMADWDAAMDAMNDLMGFPLLRGKETMYPQVDVLFRSSVHAPGYPSVNVTDTNANDRGGYHSHHLVRGPQFASDFEFHEQGHAYRFPKFGGETEANVNLHHAAVWHRKFGFDLDHAFAASRGSAGNPHRTIDNTAVTWMTVFNFSPREVPMASGEKAYQLKGHAKFIDIVRLFGWEGLDQFWYSHMFEEENGTLPANAGSTDGLLLRLCQSVGEDIRPLLHFWGIHPGDPAALQAAVDAEGLFPSPEIYEHLVHYQSLVPANNAAFQTFALNWWNKQPSINGNWTEREHARQWDATELFGEGDQQRPNGEIYTGDSAADITARVQELIDLYFPDHTVWSVLFAGADLDDPDADFDGDGLSNHDERIWGLDPTSPTSLSPISTPPEDIVADFIYTRRDEVLTGKTFTVWISTDLINWTPDPGAVQDPGDPDANGVETVGVTLSPGSLATPQVFVRMSAE